jgi:hypothetical protein
VQCAQQNGRTQSAWVRTRPGQFPTSTTSLPSA